MPCREEEKYVARALSPSWLTITPILRHDYLVNNPWNPDVRGVNKREIQDLFPGCRIKLQRATLARLLAPYSFLLCSLLEKIRIFNTHYLGVIRKAT
jgi:hypothetical protein